MTNGKQNIWEIVPTISMELALNGLQWGQIILVYIL